MSTRMTTAWLAAALTTLGAGAALANEPQPAPDPQPLPTLSEDQQQPMPEQLPDETEPQPRPQPPPPPRTSEADLSSQGRDVGRIVQITQRAMAHVAAAQTALRDQDPKAAKRALQASERELVQLYGAPALPKLIDGIDDAIANLEGAKAEAGKPGAVVPRDVDLAPLDASIQTYRSYLDPEIVAGVQRAKQQASQGDLEGSTSSLRMVRERVAVEMAFVPVEEAYVRVLAAERALERGNVAQASKFLDGVPVIVSEVQISQPLVPVRFKLRAAAIAADEGNLTRSQQLLESANQDLQRLEQVQPKSDAARDITALSDQLDQLEQQAQQGDLDAQRVRELAQQTQDIGT